MNRKAFTLVEIMIVVAIVALLAGVAIPNMIRARIDANQTAAQATLKSLAVACETYAADNAGLYPASVDDLVANTYPPYFSYDLSVHDSASNLKQGYYYVIAFGDAGDNNYTVTARCIQNTGNYDYRVTTGAFLERSLRDQDSWAGY